MSVLPSSAREATPILAAGGDNFRTVGHWKILAGGGWHRWQMAAIEAEIAASRLQGDMVSAARQEHRLREKRMGGPDTHLMPPNEQRGR